VIGGSGSQEACSQRPAGGCKVAVALGSQKTGRQSKKQPVNFILAPGVFVLTSSFFMS
jgi:hypothetical protein